MWTYYVCALYSRYKNQSKVKLRLKTSIGNKKNKNDEEIHKNGIFCADGCFYFLLVAFKCFGFTFTYMVYF